ncbi:unnamed protein product [Orchesella dallaii]|uniref:Uncharacterized protein n=1 Tax=Orchesella dallaii TaxID=48710 RepID=A0ABP1PSE6_9HEXA
MKRFTIIFATIAIAARMGAVSAHVPVCTHESFTCEVTTGVTPPDCVALTGSPTAAVRCCDECSYLGLVVTSYCKCCALVSTPCFKCEDIPLPVP